MSGASCVEDSSRDLRHMPDGSPRETRQDCTRTEAEGLLMGNGGWRRRGDAEPIGCNAWQILSRTPRLPPRSNSAVNWTGGTRKCRML